MTSDEKLAGGASSARYKLADYLRGYGIMVNYIAPHPPGDKDFLAAIMKFADECRSKPNQILKPPTFSRFSGLQGMIQKNQKRKQKNKKAHTEARSNSSS